jgi:hypothetical protein
MDMEVFARAMLEAAYEATLLAACNVAAKRKQDNAGRETRVTVYLTVLGAGAGGYRSVSHQSAHTKCLTSVTLSLPG